MLGYNAKGCNVDHAFKVEFTFDLSDRNYSLDMYYDLGAKSLETVSFHSNNAGHRFYQPYPVLK